MGNVLADYEDGGGVVVVGDHAWYYRLVRYFTIQRNPRPKLSITIEALEWQFSSRPLDVASVSARQEWVADKRLAKSWR
jgi:hypothetical protein